MKTFLIEIQFKFLILRNVSILRHALKHLHLGVFSVRAKCFKFLQLLLTNDMRRREGGRRILKNLMDMSLYYIVQDANSIRQEMRLS